MNSTKLPINGISELAKVFSIACKDVAKKSEVKVIVYIVPIVLAATVMIPEKKWADRFY